MSKPEERWQSAMDAIKAEMVWQQVRRLAEEVGDVAALGQPPPPALQRRLKLAGGALAAAVGLAEVGAMDDGHAPRPLRGPFVVALILLEHVRKLTEQVPTEEP